MGTQLALALRPGYRWGGRRDGAGRKKRSGGSSHRARPFHAKGKPVHVTMKVVRGLPTLRSHKVGRTIGTTIRAITQSHAGRTTFRIVHFSIQPNHLHLIVEAGSKETLWKGLRGLVTWLARRINQALGRKGRVFAERYHARALSTPKEVRNAIVYVLQNHKHHRPSPYPVDEYSSARWFNGWITALETPATPSPVARPGTFLARRGWRKHGLIHFDEGPAH